MAGQSAIALEAAREVSSSVPLDAVRDLPFLEKVLPTKYIALARFGRWDEMLAEPPPAPDFHYTTAMWHYARGLAFAAKGDFSAAEAELTQLLQKAPTASGGPPVLGIAGHVLAGEIAARRGDFPTAIRELESAVQLEDGLMYDEPATWHHPVRQVLGAVLLDAGRPADAERVYREDLDEYPNNGWSLFGLAQALRAQGRAAEAAEVDEAQRAAWAEADVVLERSRI